MKMVLFKKILLVIICLGLVLSSGINAFAQSSFADGMKNEGLTFDDFSSIMNYYYQKPQPDKLISITKILIAQQSFLVDPKSAVPFAHFAATVARNNDLFLNSLKNLRDLNLGLAKNYLQGIIDEAGTFRSPEPTNLDNLAQLWVEFIATGAKEPIVKIIDVLALPMTDTNASLIETTETSLTAGAVLHPKIYQFLQETIAVSSGLKKDRINNIITNSQKRVQRYFTKYGLVNNEYFAEKKERIDKMIAANPEDAKNYLSRGITNANNSNFEEALRDFQTALSLNPDLPTANNYICFIYINRGEYTEAEGYCHKAIEQSPNFSKPYFNLARIYQHWKEYPKAIEAITKAMACEQNFFEAYLLRSSIYDEAGEYEKAITDLAKAKKLNPSRSKGIDAQIEKIRAKIK